MNEREKIERFDVLPSTNDYAKQKRAEGKNRIIIAKTQSGGRGTKGRSFVSDEGGLYMSKLTFYENLPAKKAFTVMQQCAVAVCETLAAFGVRGQIKWPNDILVNGKKICGILIENTFSGEYVRCSIVGIGLNVCNRLPDELQKAATTIEEQTGKSYAVEEVERVLLETLSMENLGEKYTNYLGFIGERITLLCADKRTEAILLGVDEEGRLIAEIEGEKQLFFSAEVSLRGGVCNIF